MIFLTDKTQAHLQDLHMHTTFCDGKNTPEEMVLSAIEKGLKVVGISCHSYTDFTGECCVKPENELLFVKTVNELKKKYADKIKVLVGIEYDLFTTASMGEYDYVIGSVHYYKRGDKYNFIDRSKPEFLRSVKELFNGDYYSAVEEYYENVSNVVEKTNCDIIGHIDLVSKFNQDYNLFDETHPRYVNAYKKTIDKLVKYNKPFEINTGAISRGYRNEPYPSNQILEYIKSKGGYFILSSDSHAKENIAYQYDKWKGLL